MSRRSFQCFAISGLIGFWLSLGVSQAFDLKVPKKPLQGKFRYTMTVACANDFVGFDAQNDFAREGGGGTVMGLVQGIVEYHRDGTGQFLGQRLFVGQNQNVLGAKPIEHSDLNCQVSHKRNTDGSFTEQRSCTAHQIVGRHVGQDQTFTYELQGQLGKNRQVIVFGTTVPDIVPFTWSNGDKFSSICGRSATAVRIR